MCLLHFLCAPVAWNCNPHWRARAYQRYIGHLLFPSSPTPLIWNPFHARAYDLLGYLLGWQPEMALATLFELDSLDGAISPALALQSLTTSVGPRSLKIVHADIITALCWIACHIAAMPSGSWHKSWQQWHRYACFVTSLTNFIVPSCWQQYTVKRTIILLTIWAFHSSLDAHMCSFCEHTCKFVTCAGWSIWLMHKLVTFVFITTTLGCEVFVYRLSCEIRKTAVSGNKNCYFCIMQRPLSLLPDLSYFKSVLVHAAREQEEGATIWCCGITWRKGGGREVGKVSQGSFRLATP